MNDFSNDRDDSARESEGPTRRGLLTKAMLAGLATVPVMGMFNSRSEAAPQQSLDASSREAFTDIRLHENDHVAFLKGALGKAARPKPIFKNLSTPNFNAFVQASKAFENTGVGAYLGALPLIKNKDYVTAAASIALIEARHAGFLNVFSGIDLSTQAKINKPVAFDRALSISDVVTAVSPYVVSLNGGPALTFKAGDDVSILNFALALEYLEAEYYNINVPKYFQI